MCVGLPMQVVEPRGRYALCRSGDETRLIDMILVGDQPEGAYILVFLDAARQVINWDEAEKISDALNALALVMQGETSVDHLFADLANREPQLPAHLQSLKPKLAD